jgi:hypothetical protein
MQPGHSKIQMLTKLESNEIPLPASALWQVKEGGRCSFIVVSLIKRRANKVDHK